MVVLVVVVVIGGHGGGHGGGGGGGRRPRRRLVPCSPASFPCSHKHTNQDTWSSMFVIVVSTSVIIVTVVVTDCISIVVHFTCLPRLAMTKPTCQKPSVAAMQNRHKSALLDSVAPQGYHSDRNHQALGSILVQTLRL